MINKVYLSYFLKYGQNDERVITGLKRISKPGLRVYAKASEMPKVLNGLGIALVSTSEGVITDRRSRNVMFGGEISHTFGNKIRRCHNISSVGKKIIDIPSDVTVTFDGDHLNC